MAAETWAEQKKITKRNKKATAPRTHRVHSALQYMTLTRGSAAIPAHLRVYSVAGLRSGATFVTRRPTLVLDHSGFVTGTAPPPQCLNRRLHKRRTRYGAHCRTHTLGGRQTYSSSPALISEHAPRPSPLRHPIVQTISHAWLQAPDAHPPALPSAPTIRTQATNRHRRNISIYLHVGAAVFRAPIRRDEDDERHPALMWQRRASEWPATQYSGARHVRTRRHPRYVRRDDAGARDQEA